MSKFLRYLIYLIAAPVLTVAAYLFAALIGGLIPASVPTVQADEGAEPVTIYLTGTLLHTDIAIPATADVRERYSFLGETAFPLDHPELKYLVFGWGSKAFYTETADYSDIKFQTAWKAATGDEAVLHIGPAGNLETSEDVHAITLTSAQFDRLLDFVDSYFERTSGMPNLLVGESFGFGDVFYRSRGNFNLLNPCNVWVSSALRAAGLNSGIWTPTSYSLLISQKLYN